ncbi:MAG: VOC family protein [Chitinophagaceae bacterium]
MPVMNYRPLLFSFVFFSSIHLAAQEKPKIALNHIAVYVTDLRKSASFYQDIVGLDTISEPFHDGRHTWFSIGPKSHLHLISGAEKTSEHDKNGHLCFTVASVEDYVKKLNTAKVPFEDWAGQRSAVTLRVDGVRQIYFQDPDGYWLEINDARQ